MYINLDVLVRLGQIALIIAGIAVLIYLCLLFKSVIETMKNLQRTLDAATRDLEKLESPLSTVDSISNTVDELSVHAKQTAVTALSAMNSGAESLKGYFNKKNGKKADSKAEGEQGSQVEIIASLATEDDLPGSKNMSEKTNTNVLPDQFEPGEVTPEDKSIMNTYADEIKDGQKVFQNIEKVDEEHFGEDK